MTSASTFPSSRRSLAAGVCLFIPWVWPFAPGPSTAVAPWLVGAGCIALVALLTGGGVGRSPFVVMAVFLPLAAARAISPLEPAALGGALFVGALAMGAGAWALRTGRVGLVARIWWAAAAVSTVLALTQYFGLSGSLAPWVSPTEAGVAYGNLRQRNQFATLEAIGLAALLWEARRGTRLAQLVPLAALLAAGNAASLSRTGAIELLALVALSVLWPGRSREQALVAGSALVAYAGAALILPAALSLQGVQTVGLWERVAGPGACGSRSVLWSNVLHLIAQRPWTGWGWGELDYAHYMTLYPGARFCDILDNAHDLPLHLAVEFGLPAALLICSLALYVVIRARPWCEVDSDRQLAWSVAFVIVVHSSLEYPLWYAPFQIAFGLSLGMLWPRDVSSPHMGPVRALALPAAFALTLGYAIWDYARVSQIYLAPEERMAAYREDPLPMVRSSWLFHEYAEFAELTITPLTRANAQWQYKAALDMLHYSPEPRIIEKIIESSVLLHRSDVVSSQLLRFRAAFPKEHEEWSHGASEAAR